jgi:hypothetical protein
LSAAISDLVDLGNRTLTGASADIADSSSDGKTRNGRKHDAYRMALPEL